MTGRIGAVSIDGTPISDADVARMHADEELRAEWQRRTVRVVAAAARDIDDCRLLLSILGLDDMIAPARAELGHEPVAPIEHSPTAGMARAQGAKGAVAA
jgi:hypothetical protein